MSLEPAVEASSYQQWQILFRTHRRIQKNRLVEALTLERLKTVTVLTFLALYGVAAWFFLNRGFHFISKLPGAGGLIIDRILHVVFFCFMIMLIFSSAVTAYISIYRGKDVRWMLGLPVSHLVLFLWKCFESALFTSWGLLIIITPLLISFANQRQVSLPFYIKSFLALIPFLVICNSIGSCVLIFVGRFLNRRLFAVIAGCLAVLMVGLIWKTALEERELIKDTGLSSAITFQRVLSHTNIATNRAMPSTWLASSIVEWSHPYSMGQNWMMPCLLLSHALVLPLLLSFFGKRWFFPSWNRTLQSNAKSTGLQIGNTAANGLVWKKFGLFTRILGRPMGAVAKKDFLTFIREPAQWAQSTLIFGLLMIYAAGLDNLHENMDQPRDLYLVAYLNLAVSALALATLTTRFVFPQFSLEGQKLWILAMSPIKLSGIVTQKFLTSTLATGLCVTVILAIASHSLKFNQADTIFFSCSVLLLAIGLNALAVGLGVIFPNLRESNSAKIVSGFGGTLCLVLSFLYIILFMAILIYLRSEVFYKNELNENWYRTTKAATGFALAGGLAFLATFLPIYFSRKKLKTNGIIGKY